MTYKEAKEKAMSITTPEEVKAYLQEIETEENITNRQYYNLKYIAIEAAYC